MRSIVKASEDVTHWLDFSRSREDLARDAKDLFSSAILAIEFGKTATLNHLLGNRLKEHEKALLEAIYSIVPRISVIGERNVDFQTLDAVTQSAGEYLRLLHKLCALAEARSEAFPAGTSNEDAYAQSLRPFVQVAKKVDILDPYAGPALMSNEDRRVWFLDKLIKDNVPSIRIFTTLKWGKPNEERVPMREKQLILESAILRLLKKNDAIENKIEIVTFYPSSDFHNRRLNIELEHGSLACILDKGIETLSDNPVEAGVKFAPISKNEFNLQLNAIRSTLKLYKKASISLRG